MARDGILNIVSSVDKGKAFAGLLWASGLREKGLASSVRVYLFDPVEKLVAGEDEGLRLMIRGLIDLGVGVIASHGLAEVGGYKDKLEEFVGEERVSLTSWRRRLQLLRMTLASALYTLGGFTMGERNRVPLLPPNPFQEVMERIK